MKNWLTPIIDTDIININQFTYITDVLSLVAWKQ